MLRRLPGPDAPRLTDLILMIYQQLLVSDGDELAGPSDVAGHRLARDRRLPRKNRLENSLMLLKVLD